MRREHERVTVLCDVCMSPSNMASFDRQHVKRFAKCPLRDIHMLCNHLQHERRTHTTTVDPNAIIVSSIKEEEEEEDEDEQ